MAGLDSTAGLTAIQALLVGLVDDLSAPLLGSVVIGVPTSLGNVVAAYVALAGQIVTIKTNTSIMRQASYYVGLCYQIQGAPEGAELALAKALDAFIRAVYKDLTLGGITGKTELNLALAATPLYQIIAGQEARVFPLTLTTTQYDSYDPTP